LKLAYIEDHGKTIDNKDQVQTKQEDGVAYKLELLLLLLNVSYNSSKFFFGAKTFSNSIGV
jgi:hypothetical protein